MKKVILFVLIALVFQLPGCSKSTVTNDDRLILDNATAIKSSNDNYVIKMNIALVMKTLTNPYFVDMEKGARKAEMELGVNLLVRTCAQETSIEQQINIVNELINEKVDAIVIAPAHSIELIPVLKKAQVAGIIIVNIDNRLDPKAAKDMGLVNVPYISVNNKEAAYLAAKYISDKIVHPTDVLIIEGIRGADNSEQRKEGALRAFSENKNIQVVAVETANWKIDEALSVTSKLYNIYPNIGAVYCANDMMALGTVEYISKTNKNGVIVGGFDALKEAKDAIRQGKMMVTIDQQADLQGYTGVKFAVILNQSEKVPMETYIPIKIVDVEHID